MRSRRGKRGQDDLSGIHACSGILHPQSPALAHIHTLQYPSEVNPPAFPHYVLSQPSHSCNWCVRLCACVCVSPLFSDIPVQRGEAVSSAAERHRDRNPTQNLIRKSYDFLRPRTIRCSLFHPSITSYSGLSRLGNSNFGKICLQINSYILNKEFLGKHPLVSSQFPPVRLLTIYLLEGGLQVLDLSYFRVWEYF